MGSTGSDNPLREGVREGGREGVREGGGEGGREGGRVGGREGENCQDIKKKSTFITGLSRMNSEIV